MLRPSAMTTYASAVVASSMKPPPAWKPNGSRKSASRTASPSASCMRLSPSSRWRASPIAANGVRLPLALIALARLARLLADQALRPEDHDQDEVGEDDRRRPLAADPVVGDLLDAADDEAAENRAP